MKQESLTEVVQRNRDMRPSNNPWQSAECVRDTQVIFERSRIF